MYLKGCDGVIMAIFIRLHHIVGGADIEELDSTSAGSHHQALSV